MYKIILLLNYIGLKDIPVKIQILFLENVLLHQNFHLLFYFYFFSYFFLNKYSVHVLLFFLSILSLVTASSFGERDLCKV